MNMDEMNMPSVQQNNQYGMMDSRLFFGGPRPWGPGFFGPGFVPGFGPGFYGPGFIGPGFGGPYYGNPVFQYGLPFLGGVITGMAIDNFPRYSPYGYEAPYWEGNQSS
ncbi:hypothetical protein BN997_02599 [Oceanobacillus oncorhynchi]|uniref:Uncharacterized protein n=2 Tax=Oceanobacillus TaxID=182709 RepID=A0A0A1MI02_9BACI|nr:hypothetical protein BN997_02599 [Oceanobacillus oncorhynchi]